MFWLLLLGSYLLGAIPFGLLIGLARGVDIRQHGSRNIGATNAGRVLGRKWGFVCLALDILKGLLPTLLAGRMLVSTQPTAVDLLMWIAVGAAAVAGHTFPVYLGFRGGKGVATTIGMALGVWPYFTFGIAVGLFAYAVVRYGTGFVSAGSITLAIVFPAAVAGYVVWEGIALSVSWPLIAASAALGVLIIVRHRSNIARLLRGAEPAMTPAGGPDRDAPPATGDGNTRG
ncbi:MAG: glycerol-3-phosphate 1-O-acyltransferase [Planctomycetota bacterium]|nr:MAG: glycerol-3-phosphate 1-O-acyltransferase [Planctomycetota bacterium]